MLSFYSFVEHARMVPSTIRCSYQTDLVDADAKNNKEEKKRLPCLRKARFLVCVGQLENERREYGMCFNHIDQELFRDVHIKLYSAMDLSSNRECDLSYIKQAYNMWTCLDELIGFASMSLDKEEKKTHDHPEPELENKEEKQKRQDKIEQLHQKRNHINHLKCKFEEYKISFKDAVEQCLICDEDDDELHYPFSMNTLDFICQASRMEEGEDNKNRVSFNYERFFGRCEFYLKKS